MFVFTLLTSIVVHAAARAPYEVRVVVASPRARLAVVELQSAERLQYRACRDFPVLPSDVPHCARLGDELANTPEARAALEAEFTTQFQKAMDRAALANSGLSVAIRALAWGVAGTVLQAAVDRVLRGPGVNVSELSLGFIGYAAGSVMFDVHFAYQRRQDATLERRMRDMRDSNQPNRLTGTDLIRARRDLGIVQGALKRAIKGVSAAPAHQPPAAGAA